MTQLGLHFDGPDVEPEDAARLHGQLKRVRVFMSDGHWRKLREIAFHVGCSEPSASARLRDLRKPRFGALHVDRRPVPGARGLFEYRIEANTEREE